jgi:hypothetical protein
MRLLAPFLVSGRRSKRYMRKEDIEMATYIMLMRYTQQGMEKIKEAPSRLDASKKIF